MTETNSVALRVLRRVADRHGCDPVDLEPPLVDRIDPEALEAIYAAEGANATVTFDYAGHRVRVDGRDGVTVEPTPVAPAD
jgi:hypothetical protein